MKRFGNRLRAVLWYGVVSTIIVAAVLFSLVRMALPAADTFRGQLEELISAHLGRPVRISTLDALLPGISPTLILEQVTLFDEAGSEPVLTLPALRLKLDPVTSLRRMEPVLDSLVVRGLELSIERKVDGRLAIKGLEFPPQAPEGSAGDWLLTRSRIALRDSRIVWNDEATGGSLTFESVQLELRHDAGRHRLTGTLRSPDGLGDSVEIALDLRGNPTRDTQWSGKGWARGAGLQPAALARAGLILPLSVSRGSMDLETWATFTGGHLTRLRGRVDARGLTVGDAGRSETVDRLAARFDWFGEGEAWGVDLRDLYVARAGGQWRSERAGVRMDGHDPLSGRVWADQIRLQDLKALAMLVPTLPEESRRHLEQAAPAGDLRNVRVELGEGGQAFAFEAHQLSINPLEKWPGVTNLDFSVRYRDGAGVVELEGHGGSLRSDTLFPEPLAFQRLRGQIQFERGPSLWRVSASRLEVGNRDLDAEVGLDLYLREGRAPFLALQGDVRYLDPRRIGAYLPRKGVPQPTVDWLSRAFPSGWVTNGAVLFHGPLDSFPFDRGQGRFEVRFDARDVTLAYAPDWPNIEKIKGTVAFEGARLTIAAQQGQVAGNALSPTRAEIADLRNPRLRIEGSAHGSVGGGVRFLRESPLGAGLAILREGEGRGPLSLDLRLELPLGRNSGEAHPGHRVNGHLTFREGEFTLYERLHLRQVAGSLRFTEEMFQSEGLNGELFDRPLAITVQTSERDGVTEVALDGGLAADSLHDWGPLLQRLQGEARWDGVLRIPGRGEPVSLQLSSDLLGLDVDLPRPLGKLSESRSPLQAEWSVNAEGKGSLAVDLGERFAMALQLDQGQLAAGGIHFGAGAPAVVRPGELRVSGSLHAVEPGQWLSLLEDLPQETDAGRPLQRVIELDTVHIRRPPPDAVRGTNLEPRSADLPAMRLKVRRLLYDGADLGQVGFVIRRSSATTHIDDIYLRGPLVELTGDLRRHAGNVPLVNSRLQLAAPDLGLLLRELQVASAVEQGRTQVSGELSWTGGGWLPEPESLRGELRTRITDGRLVDVDPGAGRLLGLLSLRALPRRLFLDFSDLFQTGMQFERIDGTLRLADGQALTDDLSIRSLQASVLIAGSSDLTARTFDYRVRVQPDVRAGLPLAGGLVLGPQAGAMLLFFQRVFRSEIAEATQIEYRIGGGWDDPVIERRR